MSTREDRPLFLYSKANFFSKTKVEQISHRKYKMSSYRPVFCCILSFILNVLIILIHLSHINRWSSKHIFPNRSLNNQTWSPDTRMGRRIAVTLIDRYTDILKSLNMYYSMNCRSNVEPHIDFHGRQMLI